jgi:hypothetical protein
MARSPISRSSGVLPAGGAGVSTSRQFKSKFKAETIGFGCQRKLKQRRGHNVAWAADALLAAEAELHLALEHPHDLFVCVAVWLNMDAGPYAPPDEHPLVARENAAADLFVSSRRRSQRSQPRG